MLDRGMMERLFLPQKLLITFYMHTNIGVHIVYIHIYTHTCIYVDLIRTHLINIVLSFRFPPGFLCKQWEWNPFSHSSASTLYLAWIWQTVVLFQQSNIKSECHILVFSLLFITIVKSQVPKCLTQVWTPITVNICLTSKTSRLLQNVIWIARALQVAK